jgi:hypothetical protein
MNRRDQQWLRYQAYVRAVLVAVSADASYRDLNHRSLFATSQSRDINGQDIHTQCHTNTNKKTHIHKKRVDKYLHSALHGTGDGQSLPAVGDARHGSRALKGSRLGLGGAQLREAWQVWAKVVALNESNLDHKYRRLVLDAVRAHAAKRRLDFGRLRKIQEESVTII